MSLPVQIGLPGGPELLVILMILLLFAIPVVLAALLGVGVLLWSRSGDDGTSVERSPGSDRAAPGGETDEREDDEESISERESQPG